MNTKAFGGLVGLACVVACLTSTGAESKDADSPDAVHRLVLPEIKSELPAGKGMETVQVQCGVCHTSHYILNQPPFPRATWTAEVTKMQKAFGAPIPPEKVAGIVDYLVAVRGTPAPNAK